MNNFSPENFASISWIPSIIKSSHFLERFSALQKLCTCAHLGSSACFADYLVNRAEITLGSLDKLQQSHMLFLGNRNGERRHVFWLVSIGFTYLLKRSLLCQKKDASGLLRAVTQFSHLAADTIVNGAATSHSAPTDQADRKTRATQPARRLSRILI